MGDSVTGFPASLPNTGGDREPDLQQAAFEAAADAIIVCDDQGRILQANKQAALLFHCPPTELLTMNLDNFQMNPAPPFASEMTRWEGTFKTCDGFTLPVEITRSDLVDTHNGLFVLVLRDMSAHMAALKEYERLVADLDDFAHVVAHDLQNPLNNIMHSVDMLMDDSNLYTPEVLHKITGVAARSTHKALNIIDELLLLAGVRQDQGVPIAPLDMGMVVAEAVERLQYMIEDSEAVVVLPDDWPIAVGYAPWVEEVWANYISNALKYGGTPPSLTLGGQVLKDGMVRFWVHDNGQGIKSEDQDKLFVPFSRLDRLRARGYGLGLSIVDRIVTRLGGTVGFWNAPEGGAVFSFTLPASVSGNLRGNQR